MGVSLAIIGGIYSDPDNNNELWDSQIDLNPKIKQKKEGLDRKGSSQIDLNPTRQSHHEDQ